MTDILSISETLFYLNYQYFRPLQGILVALKSSYRGFSTPITSIKHINVFTTRKY